MPDTDPILVSHDGPVATITINRPEVRNALDRAGWQRLAHEFAALDVIESVRCVVVRGAGGRAFGAGADVREFESGRSNVEQATDYGRIMDTAMASIIESVHPIIALIEGDCVGGGLEIACACDLRICGASSRFGIPVNRLGLTMAYGELRALLSVVSPPIAKEILFSGDLFPAERAIEMGLVNRVVEDDLVEVEAYDLAQRIASGAPLVNRWHKTFIRRLADPEPLSEAELAVGYEAFGTADFERGYRAFLDKTVPEFEGD